jgi:hypothetical protein
VNYIAAAKERWPGRSVFGDGRFAVTAKDGGVVYLAVTAQQQCNIALGIERPIKVDLDLARTLEKVRDIESPEERRERRRANAQA